MVRIRLSRYPSPRNKLTRSNPTRRDFNIALALTPLLTAGIGGVGAGIVRATEHKLTADNDIVTVDTAMSSVDQGGTDATR